MAVALCAPGRADENHVFTPDYFLRVGIDFGGLLRAPLHWDRTEWLIAGGILGATYGAYTVDNAGRRLFLHHWTGQNLRELSGAVTHFGDWQYQVPLMAGCWLTGFVTGSAFFDKLAADGAEASLLSAGIIGPSIVYATGRDLPNKNRPAYEFTPFSSGRVSFPSGHTTEAFAMASVLDHNLRPYWGFWQTPVLYLLAGAVGFSRMHDQKHYLSDVVLGAGLGWSVGTWVSRKPRNAPAASVAPSSAGPVLAWTVRI